MTGRSPSYVRCRLPCIALARGQRDRNGSGPCRHRSHHAKNIMEMRSQAVRRQPGLVMLARAPRSLFFTHTGRWWWLLLCDFAGRRYAGPYAHNLSPARRRMVFAVAARPGYREPRRRSGLAAAVNGNPVTSSVINHGACRCGVRSCTSE